VSINVSTNPQRKVDISDEYGGVVVSFTYSVEWVHLPDLIWEDRMSRYHDSRFLPGTFEVRHTDGIRPLRVFTTRACDVQIHWLSIINSFVLVLLLTAFLTIILMRVLKNDFTRYMDVEDVRAPPPLPPPFCVCGSRHSGEMQGDMEEEETGWKLIHGDVFRYPKAINLFSALLGSGAQLCCTTFILLVCAIVGLFRPTKRGAILTAMIVIYVLTSVVGGFVSARFYRQVRVLRVFSLRPHTADGGGPGAACGLWN
jgi:hypothetical protein